MPDPDITAILAQGEALNLPREAADRVFAAAYEQLKAMAINKMQKERADHTLQPTALVNEAYLRLVDPKGIHWQNRSQFFCIAARAMRQVLIDHGRKRTSGKRGGGWQRVLIEDLELTTPEAELDAAELEDALEKLAKKSERMVQVVELRVFAGLQGKEIAAVLGVSRKTVVDDWRFASMWLRAVLSGQEPGSE